MARRGNARRRIGGIHRVDAAKRYDGIAIEVAARARIYGMPYAEWKAKYQTDANPAQLQEFQQMQHDQ